MCVGKALQEKNLRLVLATLIFITSFFLGGEQKAMSFSIFSNKKYSQYIEVEPYLMNNIQIGEIFLNSKESIVQYPYKELDLLKVYYVVRIRNKENMVAWGEIEASIGQKRLPNIHVPGLRANMESFVTFVIPIHGIVFTRLMKRKCQNLK